MVVFVSPRIKKYLNRRENHVGHISAPWPAMIATNTRDVQLAQPQTGWSLDDATRLRAEIDGRLLTYKPRTAIKTGGRDRRRPGPPTTQPNAARPPVMHWNAMNMAQMR
jgi:hypothetical protein